VVSKSNMDKYQQKSNFISKIYGISLYMEPKKYEFFEFEAYIIYDRNNPKRKFIISNEYGTDFITTDTFKLYYSKWGENNSGPYVFINHGLMDKRILWNNIIRYLILVGFRVVLFDMLGVGKSTKPIFNNKEKIEKLRWKYDIYYVEGLVNYLIGTSDNFIFISQGWGNGILKKYLERFGQRVLWFACFDDTIHINTIELLSKCSFLPLDLDKKVINNYIPASLGTFQDIIKNKEYNIRIILRELTCKNDDLSLSDEFPIQLDPYLFFKSIIDRAFIMLNTNDILPYHSQKNKDGIRYTKIKNYGIFFSEKMISNRYKFWMPNSRIYNVIHRGNSEEIANQLIEFHNLIFPPGRLNSLPAKYIGFGDFINGNEEEEVKHYLKLYNSLI